MRSNANVGRQATPARRPPSNRLATRIAAATCATLTAAVMDGCSLTPAGATEEEARLGVAGERYAKPLEQRTLREIPAEPTWRDVLHRAFMANGELEAAYFEWQAAFERIDIAAAWPNSNLSLGYSYALGPGQMNAFDRMTFSGAIDSMENLSFPSKVAQGARVALDEARASGERFRAAKFELQRRVLTAWAEYAFLAERVRIRADQVTLTKAGLDTARSRVQFGGTQDDLLRADVAHRLAEDALRTSEAELSATRAALNAMLARDPDAPLPAPRSVPDPRPLPEDDAGLLAVAVDQNPELAALFHGVEGRSDALERARQEWIPDINPFVGLTGGIAQVVGASIVLPTTIKQIEGGIREADAMLRSSEALLRQRTREKTATFAATLVLLRDAERQSVLFEQTLIPATERTVTTVLQRYAIGAASYLEVLDAQRVLLESRLILARAKTMRETRLAELEALMGADVETLEPSSASTHTSSSQARLSVGSVPPTGTLENAHDH